MLRLGITDFDSSHSAEFTRRFNHVGVDRDQHVEDARVVLGWPGTSLMAPERIPGFQAEVESCGVELVESPEQMLGRIDAVLVLSLSGMAHLERARPFLEAGVPTFVDKPFACSTADARAMITLAAQHGTFLFNASGLRFASEVVEVVRRSEELGGLTGIVTYGPAKRAEGNPGLFHYGIHAVEMLFALLGPGCREVTTTHTRDTDVVTGTWSDGRVGTVRGGRSGSTAYGCVAFCRDGVLPQLISTQNAYRNLCRTIVESVTSGRPAVPPAEFFEVVAFIEAAMTSEQYGGAVVPLETL